MNTQENINYKRIAEAIDYIKDNFKQQPNLHEVAEKVHLSPLIFSGYLPNGQEQARRSFFNT